MGGKGGYSGLRRKLRGKGDFVDDLVGGGARLVGNGIRSGISWLTDKAGGMLKNLLGNGDYLTSAMPTMNSHVMGAMPTMVGNKDSPAFIMEFVEEIAGLTATDVFKSTVFHLQPGLSDTFKWLPGIARKFEQYELEAMVVMYKPTITPLNDAASGDLVFNVVYDANGSVPQNITTALNSYLAVGGRPLDQMMAAVECAPSQTPTRVKFVRAADPPEDADHNLYDWGKLCVSQEGQPTATVGQAIGRLYLSYKFRFYKPLVQFDSLDVPTAHYYVQSAASTAPIGATEAAFTRRSDDTFLLTWVDGDTFAMPSYVQEGKWLIVYFAQGYTSGATTAPTISASGASAINIWNASGIPSGTALAIAPTAASTSQKLMSAWTFTVTAPGPTINFSSQIWTGNAQVDVLLMPLDVDLVALSARRQAYQQWGKTRDRRRVEMLQFEAKEVASLREQMDDLRRMISNGAERYEEKEDDGGILPPPRARKRVIEQESDDDGVSVVSVTQGRSKSQPAKAG